MSETEKEEFITRSYQTNIIEIALKRNTIIYLPTGSGKTYIALMLIKHLSHDILKPISEGGKLTVFLVNTVVLVEQHYFTIKRHMDFEVGKFSGEMNVDYWTEEQWYEQLNRYQIIVMTAQILLDILRHGYFNLEQINLLIFDECHQGVDDHAMRLIMQLFKDADPNKHPRVLGLTATLLNNNCKTTQVEQLVASLETTFHSKVATVKQLAEVLGYSTNPHEKIIFFSELKPDAFLQSIENKITNIINYIKAIKFDNSDQTLSPGRILLNSSNKEIKSLENILNSLIHHTKMMGIYGSCKATLAYIIYIERLKKHTDNTIMDKILTVICTQLTAIMKILEDKMSDFANADKILKFSSHQVLKLLDILSRENNQTENLCGIIFVQRRFTAKVLYYILKDLTKCKHEFSHIRPDFMVGFNAKSIEKKSREVLYSSKANKKVMRSFKDGDINLLIASDVCEEGVDIQKCTLVVKFDFPTNYRSYIQSKGRARHKDSQYVIMVPENLMYKFDKRYKDYCEVEQILRNLLIGKNLERSSPTMEDIENDLYNDYDLPSYYVDGPSSPHVSAVSAISLLNRYCQSLTKDKYSQPVPIWYQEHNNGQYRVVIEMPIMCPLREPVVGRFMLSKISAKRAAALLVCQKLHQCGELNNNLLPLSEIDINQDTEYLFSHWLHESVTINENYCKPGTKKCIRVHEMQIPKCLMGKSLTSNVDLHLHFMEIMPIFSSNNEPSFQMQYDLIKSDLNFALLTAKPLPTLCDFPLYLSTGEVSVHIAVNETIINVTEEELMHIRKFHNFIFKDILNILKEFLILDNKDNASTMLVIPVRKRSNNINIAFDIIKNYSVMYMVEEPTKQSKLQIRVDDETYLGKVVCPWYRMANIHYIVTKVCYDVTAKSSFPSKDYNNYMEYFADKYNVKIYNPTQPLLLVKALSKKLNCLKPRSATLHGKRNKQTIQECYEEHLIPEMCILQKFPSTLWYKSYCLPSILHRVIYLLRAEELRCTINLATKVGKVELPVGQTWEPLPVDQSIFNVEEKKVLLVQQRPVADDEILALPPIKSVTDCRPTNKDYANKMLEKMYPWKDEQEPVDIERHIDTITVVEIVDYEHFLAGTTTDVVENSDHSGQKTKLPAITSPFVDSNYVFKPIKMLDESNHSNLGPQQWQLYQVLMAAKANDVVNFERLETLGDSFLKLTVSLFLYLKYPQYNEGFLTNLKGKIVGNRNLFYIAHQKNMAGYMKVSEFSPASEWVPPGYCIPTFLKEKIMSKQLPVYKLFEFPVTPNEQITGELTSKTFTEFEEIVKSNILIGEIDEEETFSSMNKFIGHHNVQDKTVSDCVEAFIGVYLLTNGKQGGLGLLKWLGIIPPDECPTELFETSPPSPLLNRTEKIKSIDNYLPNYKKLEQSLGYKFKDPFYLVQALTHCSYTSSRITDCYQRLEFLGDAILDFLVTCHIYEISMELTPGQLTDLRSALVNNVTFAGFTIRHGFHKYLKSMNTKLTDVIDTFVKYQEERNFAINEEILILSEEGPSIIAEHVHVPKALGDILEALAGAVFLDSGMNLQETWRIFHRIMWKEIELFRNNVPKSPVRMLYEYVGAAPHFDNPKTIENGITMVGLAILVDGIKQTVYGFGENKKQAKRAAAKLALRLLYKTN